MSLINAVTARPNRLSESDKGDKYHLEFGRWCMSAFSSDSYRKFSEKCDINWAFYKGDQWIFEEDQENFFTDEAGGVKNRIMVTQNMIQPLVNYYRGVIMQSKTEVKLKSVDNRSSNRKEAERKRLEAYQRLAEVPALQNAIKNNVALGDDLSETLSLFESSYVDDIVDDINMLTKAIGERINVHEIMVRGAKDLVLSGLMVYNGEEHNMEYIGDNVDVRRFAWDPNATKPDLSDSTMFCEYIPMDLVDICEKWKISSKEKKWIEEEIIRANTHSFRTENYRYPFLSVGKPCVVKSVWLDIVTITCAWVEYDKGLFGVFVLDEDGMWNGKKPAKKSQLTKEQLAEFDGEVTQDIDVDDWRYCYFIPRESVSDDEGADIVLEYGSMPFQERDRQRPAYSKVPYKCYTWDYDNGEVMSPIDTIIDPQRMINRITSILESKINAAGGSGVAISEEAVASTGQSQEEVQGRINRGETIFVKANSIGGVNQAVGAYDASYKGSDKIYQSIEAFRNVISNNTGVNDAMLGTQQGADQLVGVLDSQINRGSIMQQPYFWAMKHMLKSIYEDIMNKGRKIAAENNRLISAIVGREVKTIRVTKELALEDMRAYVDVTEPEMTAVEKGNQMLLTLFSASLIDSVTFSECFNKSDLEDVSKALYRYQTQKAMAEEKAAMASQEKENTMIQMGIDQQNADREMDANSKMMTDQFNRDKLASNERNNIRSNQAKK